MNETQPQAPKPEDPGTDRFFIAVFDDGSSKRYTFHSEEILPAHEDWHKAAILAVAQANKVGTTLISLTYTRNVL